MAWYVIWKTICFLLWKYFGILIDTCQLRLDFEAFDIMGPSGSEEMGGGACEEDSLVVTQTPTSNVNVPVICGLNSGQHSK